MNRRNCQIDHGSVAGGRAESHVARSSIAPFALDDTITGFEIIYGSALACSCIAIVFITAAVHIRRFLKQGQL